MAGPVQLAAAVVLVQPATTAPPAAPSPNRATTNTSRRSRACASSSRRTSCGRSTTPGTSTPDPTRGNATLTSIRRVIDRRYGPSTSAQMFADKAQLAHYETTRAQFESFAAGGWDSHKMTIYWMLNSHWPSFFGNIFDYYLRPGGAYYGAKKGLRPLSVVFDSYATGDHSQAKVTVVNQTPGRARRTCACGCAPTTCRAGCATTAPPTASTSPPGGAAPAVTLPPGPRDSPVFFVRCEVLDAAGNVVAENVYWQSQQHRRRRDPDQRLRPSNSNQVSWADMTALNTMAKVPLDVTAGDAIGAATCDIALRNPTPAVAFFERAELPSTRDGDEILPIEYDDNYVTVFPGETVAHSRPGARPGRIRRPVPSWVRVTGYGGTPVVVPVR